MSCLYGVPTDVYTHSFSPWHWNNLVFSQSSIGSCNMGTTCTNKGLRLWIQDASISPTLKTSWAKLSSVFANSKKTTHLCVCVCVLIQGCISACATCTLGKQTVSMQKHWAMQTLCNTRANLTAVHSSVNITWVTAEGWGRVCWMELGL